MNRATSRFALVVGGYGDLGTAISDRLRRDGYQLLRASRRERSDVEAVVLDRLGLEVLPVFDAVCWAQGVNVNDAVDGFEEADLSALFDANVAVVARQLRDLLAAGRISDGASLVVISSIWQQVARPGKFSYTVTKAAVGGLVRAAAMDLAPRGIRVNAVLPGVVDTEMTRDMLSVDQLEAVGKATGHGRLTSAAEVADAVASLLSPTSAITGQSLLVDLGFSLGRQL
jgi:3-oxoacyl-[acyl-carrier protein] reductase